MNKIFRISDFCHFVDVDKHITALYNSLSLEVVFVKKEIATIFKQTLGNIVDLSFEIALEDFIDTLLKMNIIFPLGERRDIKDYLKAQSLLRDDGVSVLYLLLTDGCNLGCSYCYIENALPKDYFFSMMTKEIAEKSLNLFARNISKKIEEPKVILYGGEPLMNMELVFYTIKRFEEMKLEKKLPQKTTLIINTNATLIDKQFLDFVQDKKIQIAVSLDGTKEMHDSMRKFKNGEGTYDKVAKNCKTMSERGIKYGFSITITKANIFNLEENLLWLHDEFGVDSIGFNIVIHQNKKIIGMSVEEYADLVTQKLISCFKISR